MGEGMKVDDNGDFYDLIAALVKVAIGESKLHLCWIRTEWDPGRGNSFDACAKVDITLSGDVTGSLTLSGAVGRRVYDLYELYRRVGKGDRQLGDLCDHPGCIGGRR